MHTMNALGMKCQSVAKNAY